MCDFISVSPVKGTETEMFTKEKNGRKTTKFVRWITVLRDNLIRQRFHLHNYSACMYTVIKKFRSFNKKMPFLLLSVISLNDTFCTFLKDKKMCNISRSNLGLYLSIFSATRSVPTKLLDKFTWAISSKELKMYFLASCDFILVSLSCSLPVCQKQKQFFTAHAEQNVYMCSKIFLQMKRLSTQLQCTHRGNLPGTSNQWKLLIGKEINQAFFLNSSTNINW